MGNFPQWAHLCHTKFPAPPGPGAHDQVCAGEQDMEPVHVLGYAPVRDLGITELLLDDQKWMLYFAACGRLPLFHFPVPVDSFVRAAAPDAGRSFVGTELNT